MALDGRAIIKEGTPVKFICGLSEAQKRAGISPALFVFIHRYQE
jgi:hypothetical protein